jgi:hypothetical protein
MLTIKDIVLVIAAPAMWTAIVLSVAWRPWRRSEAASGYWGNALALGGGFAIACLRVPGWPGFPPTSATNWLFFFPPALIVLGVADATWPLPRWLRYAAAAVACAAATWLLVRPMLQGAWTPAVFGTWLAGVTAALTIAWAVLDVHAERTPGWPLPLSLALVSGVASVVLVLSGSLKLGLLGVALSATLGSCVLVAWWSGVLRLARGGVTVFIALHTALVVCGHLYAYLTMPNGILLLIAPLLTTVIRVRQLQQLPVWPRQLIQLVVVLAPLGLALALALANQAANSSGDYAY